MPHELDDYLDSLARDDCYRVEAVLKAAAAETTQKVWFVGANGAEQGPFVRKILSLDEGLGSAYERIWREQAKGARFRSIPRVIDCYSTESARMVIMEYVQAETVEEVVYRCDPSLALAADLFPRVCEAVRELHERFDPPLIHRDLKPTNIMVSQGGVTLIDFSIARTYEKGAWNDTAYFGTRAYAPPEQFGFGQTDVRSDVYALGLVLFYLLVEKTPDANDRACGFAHADVPEAVRAVVAKAAALDPAERYQTVADLQAAAETAFRTAAQGQVTRSVVVSGDGRACAVSGGEEAAAPRTAMCGGEEAAAARASSLDGNVGDGEASGAVRLSASADCGVAFAPASAAAPLPVPEFVPPVALASASASASAMEPALAPMPAPAPVSAPAPVTASQELHRAPANRADASRSPLSRIPFAVGAVWDVLLAMDAVLFLAGCVATAIDPQPDSSIAVYGLAKRLFMCVIMYLTLFLPVLYGMCDRRPLRALFPRLPWRSVRKEFMVIACIVAAGIVAIGIVMYLPF